LAPTSLLVVRDQIGKGRLLAARNCGAPKKDTALGAGCEGLGVNDAYLEGELQSRMGRWTQIINQ
jgi:hypothetical protein